MASIQKRDNGRWRARFRDAGGKEYAKHFDRKRDAEAWLTEVQSSMLTQTYVAPSAGRATFDDWFRAYASQQVWTDGTRAAAAQAAAGVTFGKVRLRDITTVHVDGWVKSLQTPSGGRQQGLAVSTLHTRFNYVHGAFVAAMRAREIGRDPCEGVKLPKKPKKAVDVSRIPTPEAVGKAIGAAPDWFSTYVAVCAFAGLRLGEAAGLQVGDVDFLRRTLTVRRQVQGTNATNSKIVPPKYGSRRDVHIPEGLVTMLSQHIGAHGTAGEERWLFSDVWGNRLNRSSAGHQWRRTRALVGLERFTLHDLRHFYASGLIASGCDVVTVQRALGHSSASFTLDTYSHLWQDSADRMRSAAQGLMDSALGQTSGLNLASK